MYINNNLCTSQVRRVLADLARTKSENPATDNVESPEMAARPDVVLPETDIRPEVEAASTGTRPEVVSPETNIQPEVESPETVTRPEVESPEMVTRPEVESATALEHPKVSEEGHESDRNEDVGHDEGAGGHGEAAADPGQSDRPQDRAEDAEARRLLQEVFDESPMQKAKRMIHSRKFRE
jgi:hypothetical protein